MFKLKEENVLFLKTATPEEKFKYGMIMWFLLFMGYFVFCLNWIMMDGLSGASLSGGNYSANKGWSKYFSEGRGLATLKVAFEAPSYSVSFARGVATIGTAWIMVKLSHKWAVVIALFLNTIAMPLIFAPHFALFVIGRMIMAFGGTMLIIFIQPVLARFFDIKYKGLLSVITPLAYLTGALVAKIIFINQGVTEYFQEHWQAVAATCAAFSYIPLFVYPFVGKNFLTSDNMEQDIAQVELPKNTYKGIIKEPLMWFWIIWYSFLLAAALIVSLMAPSIFEKVNPQLLQATGASWKSSYAICFFVGCICGMVLGRWNKTEYRRKPFITLACCMSAVLWMSIAALGLTPFASSHSTAATVLIFIFVFFFAFFSMGIQSVILYIPHEYEENDNAKRLTIFYSYLWGFGYIVFTLYQIAIASCLDISSNVGAYIAAGIITVLMILYGLFASLIQEPRPEFEHHRWFIKLFSPFQFKKLGK